MYGWRSQTSDGRRGKAGTSVTGAAAEPLSRRAAVKRLALAAGGLAVGCTPLRIVLRAYPDDFDRDTELLDRVLRAFVTTVVPGVPPDSPNLARIFKDDWVPFARYCSFFASDLCGRSRKMFGTGAFHALSLARRTQVVQNGLAADSTTRKLYDGAIFLAQLSVYAGVYDSQRGCPLIDFEGAYKIVPLKDQTYPNPNDFLAAALTPEGNPA
jgi:hypothetical protein